MTYKDQISTIVEKRNNVVHHNDEASDLSLGDVQIYIATINK